MLTTVAQKIRGECHAVYVKEDRVTPEEERILDDDKKLCEGLGIPTIELEGEVGQTIIQYVQENNISQVILGHSDRTRLRDFLRGSLLFELARLLKSVDILVVANEAEEA
ncbi:MAG: hypothetical protein C4320_05505 [Armatimonadota bacterium]